MESEEIERELEIQVGKALFGSNGKKIDITRQCEPHNKFQQNIQSALLLGY